MKGSRLYGALAIAGLVAGVGTLVVNAITLGAPAGNQVLASICVTFGFAVIGLPALVARECAMLETPMTFGLIAGAVAWAWWLTVIWQVMPVERWWLAVPIALTTGALFAAFAGSVHLLRVADRRFRWVRAATIGVGGLLAVGFAGGMSWWIAAGIELPWRERNAIAEVLIRTGGVMMTVLVCGVLAVLASVLIPRLARGGEVADSERMDLTVTCPRCARRQQIRSHGDTCARCGLEIRVTPL